PLVLLRPTPPLTPTRSVKVERSLLPFSLPTPPPTGPEALRQTWSCHTVVSSLSFIVPCGSPRAATTSASLAPTIEGPAAAHPESRTIAKITRLIAPPNNRGDPPVSPRGFHADFAQTALFRSVEPKESDRQPEYLDHSPSTGEVCARDTKRTRASGRAGRRSRRSRRPRVPAASHRARPGSRPRRAPQSFPTARRHAAPRSS